MIKWFQPLLFPLILSLLLGGASFWLNRVTDIVIEPVVLDIHQPQYSMSGLYAIRFDEEGQLQDRLTAKNAWELPDSQRIYFKDIYLEMMDKQKPRYIGSSDRAVYDMNQKILLMTHHVILYKRNTEGQRLAEFSANDVLINTEDRSATTDTHNPRRLHIEDDVAKNLYGASKDDEPLNTRVRAVIYDTKNIKSSH